MAGKTSDSQLRASKKYLAQFKEIRIRTLPDEHEAIVAHAKAMGDKSTVAFISRAIHETMERDLQRKEQEP